MQVAVQEVRRLQRFGVTRGELERYKTALLRDRWAGRAWGWHACCNVQLAACFWPEPPLARLPARSLHEAALGSDFWH
jgi:hypothetical protein